MKCIHEITFLLNNVKCTHFAWWTLKGLNDIQHSTDFYSHKIYAWSLKWFIYCAFSNEYMIFFALYIKFVVCTLFRRQLKNKVYLYIFTLEAIFFAQMYMNVLCNAWTVKYYKLKWINSTLGLFVPLSCQMTCTDGEKHFIRY